MRKQRVILLALAAAMTASLATGCGSQKTEEKAENKQTAGAAAEETLEGSLVSAEPKEFTIFLNFNNMPFDPSWQVWQEVAKRTNISLKGTISKTNSNEEEAFNLMLSSGQLADIIGYVDASELEKLGRDGGLVPLNDLIDQYAPNIKKVLEEDERYRQEMCIRDSLYTCP